MRNRNEFCAHKDKRPRLKFSIRKFRYEIDKDGS